MRAGLSRCGGRVASSRPPTDAATPPHGRREGWRGHYGHCAGHKRHPAARRDRRRPLGLGRISEPYLRRASVGVAAKDLGRHVGRRAAEELQAVLLAVGELDGEAQVHQLQALRHARDAAAAERLVDEDVVELDVAVHDVQVVHVLQTAEERQEERPRLRLRHGLPGVLLAHVVDEVAAGAELHHDVRPTRRLERLEELRHVRVVQGRHELLLALELPHHRRVAHELGAVVELDRHLLARQLVHRQPHLAEVTLQGRAESTGGARGQRAESATQSRGAIRWRGLSSAAASATARRRPESAHT